MKVSTSRARHGRPSTIVSVKPGEDVKDEFLDRVGDIAEQNEEEVRKPRGPPPKSTPSTYQGGSGKNFAQMVSSNAPTNMSTTGRSSAKQPMLSRRR